MMTSVHRQAGLGSSSRSLRKPVSAPRVGSIKTGGRHVPKATFTELSNGAWLVHGSPNRAPKGLCHFLGGAFAGAAPQALYNLFLDLLADDGYTVITTPYHVTFRHAECAQLVHQAFQDSLQEMRESGRGQLAPEDAPVFGIGHSNGALLHLLMGSLLPPTYDANIIISYNNKQVSDAIPIPGFLDGLGPAVQVARQVPLPTPFTLPDLAQQVVRQAAAAVPSAVLREELLLSATPVVEQLGTVVEQVGDGTTDFTPSPSESRQIIKDQYSVPSTLLIQFSDDGIDETPEMAELLRSVNAEGTENMILPGTHITPLGADLRWDVQRTFTPLDAVAMAAKAIAQRDIRRLVGQVGSWLDLQASSRQLMVEQWEAVAQLQGEDVLVEPVEEPVLVSANVA